LCVVRGLCVGLITRPEDCGVSEYDLEISTVRWPRPPGLTSHKKKRAFPEPGWRSRYYDWLQVRPSGSNRGSGKRLSPVQHLPDKLWGAASRALQLIPHLLLVPRVRMSGAVLVLPTSLFVLEYVRPYSNRYVQRVTLRADLLWWCVYWAYW